MTPGSAQKDYVVCGQCGHRFAIEHIPAHCPKCGSAAAPSPAAEARHDPLTEKFRLAAKHAKGHF